MELFAELVIAVPKSPPPVTASAPSVAVAIGMDRRLLLPFVTNCNCAELQRFGGDVGELEEEDEQ